MTDSTRLAAIVCADAVGFGARAAADEAAAHAALEDGRQTLRRIFEAEGGQIINTWGDGVIAEFASIGAAVRAATAFQREYDGREGAFRFRIGINLADVVHEHHDLFGHGVNVAARLQQAATPGGVLISEAVHAAIADRHIAGFERIAPVTGKANEPLIPAWRATLGDNAPSKADPPTPPPVPATVSAPGRAWIVSVWARMTSAERRGAVLIGFLAVINLLSGADTAWFLWPALPIAALLLMRRLTRDDGQGDDGFNDTRHKRRFSMHRRRRPD